MHDKQIKRLDSLQVFRGLAALGVVVHHSAVSTSAFVGKIPDWLNSIFEYGFLGVDFFFVLSGFIIMSSHFDDDKSLAALKTYGIKRFLRIFPPYWPVALVLMLSYFLLPNLSQGTRGDYSLFSTLLLLPDVAPPALSVAWTLIHEVMFYMIFCLYFISSRALIIFITVWVVAIVANVWFIENGNFSPVITLLLNPINLEFVSGMGIAYLARKGAKGLASGWILLGIFIFVLMLLWPFSAEFRVLFCLPFSLLILGAALLERRGKLAFPRWMVLIGDASYSIYLIHNPLVSLSGRIIGKLQGFAGWGMGMVVSVVASVICGVLYHLYIETPVIRLFRQQFKRLGLIK